MSKVLPFVREDDRKFDEKVQDAERTAELRALADSELLNLDLDRQLSGEVVERWSDFDESA